MKTVIFLQARLGSTRLPGKVLLPILGTSVIAHIVERLRRVKGVDAIVLVTGPMARNRRLIAEAKRLGLPYFAGSEENLLDRFEQAARTYRSSTIIRVTGDCPLIDPGLIESGLKTFKRGDYDLVLNGRVRSFPDGLDYEIFTRAALAAAWKKARAKESGFAARFERTPPNPITEISRLKGARIKDVVHRPNLARVRLTLDYPADYAAIKAVYGALKTKNSFRWTDVVKFLRAHPDVGRRTAKYVKFDYWV